MIVPRIATVGSYEERDAIEEFVLEALRSRPEIDELFRSPDPSRLIVVKPNWIQESHEFDPNVWQPVITHPNIILAVIEVLARRMQGQGTISLCDAPHTYADFEAIVSRGGFRDRLEAVRGRWPSLRLEMIDLRREVWTRREGVVVGRRPNPHDPRGYCRLDLARESHFFQHKGEGHYYGADYDSRPVNDHHSGDNHEYLLAGTPLASDLFVNLPKLKTHKKTGITCSLKNLVGINGDKNWLPHHTEGSPSEGGDEFPEDTSSNRIERIARRVARRTLLGSPKMGNWLYRKMRKVGQRVFGDSEVVMRSGNWHGNDTCWRMALDLNRALLYGNSDGTWREAGSPKRYLSIVDGIVGGEGNGPLCPDPVDSQVLISGTDPATVDAAASRLMGFDPLDLPIVAQAFGRHRWPIAGRDLTEATVRDDRLGREIPLSEVVPAVPGGFKPHFGWARLQEEVGVLGS